ncbi:hypothetical protein Dimus_002169 [Dionaea muscipula]
MASNLGCGWQYDFHFGIGLDTIEEDAINEKCRLQVLRILTTKADAEIIELEDNLAILQSQLKWAEHGKFDELYEIWCATFRDEIDLLDSDIHSLRNEKVLQETGSNAVLVLHREPALRIYDIISTLLRREFPKDYVQVGELPYVEAVTFDSSQTAGVKVEEQNHTATSPNSVPSNSGDQRLVPWVEKKNQPETTLIEESSLDASSCMTTYSNEEKSEVVGITRSGELNENKATYDRGDILFLLPMELDGDSDDPVKDVEDLGRDEKHGSVSSQRADKSKAIEQPIFAAIFHGDWFSWSSNKSKIKVQAARQGDNGLAGLHTFSELNNDEEKNVPEAVLKKDEPQSSDISTTDGSDTVHEKSIVSFMLKPYMLKPKRKFQPNVRAAAQPSGSPNSKMRRTCPKVVKRQQQPHGIDKDTLNPSITEAERQLCGLTKDWMIIKPPLDVGTSLVSISKIARGVRSKTIKLAERKNPAIISSCSLDREEEDAINCGIEKDWSITEPSSKDITVVASVGPCACKECDWCRSRSPSLEGMSLLQLKGLAKKHNLRGYGKLKKSSLIELLSQKIPSS